MRSGFAVPALALLAGCADVDHSAPHGPLAEWRRAAPPAAPLVLRRPEGTAPPPAERLVERLEPPADLGSWEITGIGRATVEAKRLRSGALLFAGGLGQTITIRDRFAPGDWNLVVMEVLAGGELGLRMALAREEGELLGSGDPIRVLPGELARAPFDWRHAVADGQRPFDALILGANSRETDEERAPRAIDWHLVAVELRHRPPERWLPLPEDGPQPVTVDGETRRAVGLAVGGELVAELPPAKRGELALGVTRDPGLQASDPCELRVGVRADDGGVQPLGTVAVERGWRDARLDLSGVAGGAGPRTLVFELAGPAGFVAALEPPRIVRAGAVAPTVLLVTSDTHRADHLGASEHDVGVRTPTLDALAARGVLFEDCFASSNVTLPSHAALLTGTLPRDTGVVDNRTALDAAADTLAERFAAAGWATFAATSTKLLSPGWSGLAQGFERHSSPVSDVERRGDVTLAVAERWLPGAEGRPLFLWLHLYDAHRPYDPPNEHASAYYPADRDPRDPDLELGAPQVPGLPGVRDIEYVHARYRGEVSWVDELTGRLLEHERFADAAVAFTADHGECLGDQGLWWDHLAAYPAVLHVPLVLAWPGAPGGTRVGEGVRQVDVAHTLLRLAGIEGATEFPGRDLRDWLAARPPQAAPRFAVADGGGTVAVTLGSWHLVVHLEAPEKPHLMTRDLLARPVELFDRARDPGCDEDLAALEPRRTAHMAAMLLSWAEAAPARRGEAHAASAEARSMLSGLGYGSGGEDGDPPETFVDLPLLRERLAPWLP